MTELKHLSYGQLGGALTLAEILNAKRAAARNPDQFKSAVLELYDGNNTPRNAFQDFLKTLSREAFCELVALMWFGRGNEFATFSSAYAHALVCNRTLEHIAEQGIDYLIMKSPLVKYLRAGIDKLKNPPPQDEDEEAA